jgi:murein DD-endopeptidase MepM/ murein hydrolase activator NlpD
MRWSLLFTPLFATAILASAPAATAQSTAPVAGPPPQLALPIACTINVDCWIAKYFDADPGPGASDYLDGSRTNDKHRGTDFAIRDLDAMKAGVAVLASADGKVRALRDGMDDINVRVIGVEAIKGRECGNAVVIDHAPGWATQYCHLRKGSVRVKKGQTVKAGDEIGLVGQSGLAEFPHVHLSVFRDRKRIDPFAVSDDGATQLWNAAVRSQLRYESISTYDGGFREALPETKRVKLGTIQDQKTSTLSPAIVFWAGFFGIRAGDKIKQTLLGPNGRVVAERETVQAKNQIRGFRWIGRKRGAQQWPAGEYIGRTTVTPADGALGQVSTVEVKITVARP